MECPYRKTTHHKRLKEQHFKITCTLVKHGYCLSETDQRERRDYYEAHKPVGKKKQAKLETEAQQGVLL